MPMSKRPNTAILRVALSLGAFSALLSVAEAQSSATSSRSPGYYVSPQHPDPNFPAGGSSASMYWITDPETGVPSLGYRGVRSVEYIGYDPVKGRSYMYFNDRTPDSLYGYLKGGVAIHAEALPATLVKVKEIAGNTVVYGPYADPGGETGDEDHRKAAGARASSRPAYYVSKEHPDPNFHSSGIGEDGLVWLTDPNSGLPQLSLHPTGGGVSYLGYDEESGKSYVGLGSSLYGNLYSYKKREGLVHVDGLPANIVRVKALANNINIYGPNASIDSRAASSPGAATGEPTIIKTGTAWTLAYADPSGTQRSLPLRRPHVKGRGIDFTDAEWAKHEYQSGAGMFIAEDAGKYRLVIANVSAGFPPRIYHVDIAPALGQPGMTMDEIKGMLRATQIELVE